MEYLSKQLYNCFSISKIVSITVLLISSTTTVFCQKDHYSFAYSKVDTLYLLNPIGYIGVQSGNKIEASEALTSLFQRQFNAQVKAYPKFKVIPLVDSAISTDSNKLYFVDLLYRIDHMNDEVFKSNKISDKIRELIKNTPGRYFGIVCYSGYQNKSDNEELAMALLSTGISVTFALLTGSTFWMMTSPRNPYYKVYFAVIDKKVGCVKHYNYYFNGSSKPTDVKVIKSSINEIFRELAR